MQHPAESITWLNMMLYGESGVGKTHFLGTAQDHPDTSPILILDIDGGVSTLRKRTDIDVIQVRSVTDLIRVCNDLYDAIPSDGSKFPYGTVGIDTFSELQALDLTEITRQFARLNDKLDPDIPDQRAYGKSLSHMRALLRRIRDLPCNTVITCHSQTDRDNSMKLMTFPKLVGKVKIDIPGFLDIVGYYRAEADGGELKRLLQFQKTETVIAKDRTGAFDPVEVDPTMPSLWDKLQATNVVSKGVKK